MGVLVCSFLMCYSTSSHSYEKKVIMLFSDSFSYFVTHIRDKTQPILILRVWEQGQRW